MEAITRNPLGLRRRGGPGFATCAWKCAGKRACPKSQHGRTARAVLAAQGRRDAEKDRVVCFHSASMSSIMAAALSEAVAPGSRIDDGREWYSSSPPFAIAIEGRETC